MSELKRWFDTNTHTHARTHARTHAHKQTSASKDSFGATRRQDTLEEAVCRAGGESGVAKERRGGGGGDCESDRESDRRGGERASECSEREGNASKSYDRRFVCVCAS